MSNYTHKFLIQINYKSGISVKMWFVKFKFTIDGDNYKFEWEPAINGDQVLFLNPEQIESIFQIGVEEI